MGKVIARSFCALLGLLIPARGRHRAPLPAPLPPPLPPVFRSAETLYRGEDTHLIRPYALTPEEWRERRAQQARRRTLVVAR